ncbi:MAG TPA: protein-signal peptide and transmembrane prediction [Planctomycetota bacterium]|nr:protein-signal peptide and transmembrane prediction [Planctomycetota bacterium]
MRFHGILVLLLVGCATSTKEADTLDVTLRSRAKTGETSTEAVRWDAKKTAFIICDMWDDHWCKGAAKRVVELAGPMNRMIAEARRRGVFIIHAPSTCTGFYKDTPARKRAQQAPMAKAPAPLSEKDRWGTKWCWPDPAREPDLPIDDSDMGCDCAAKCTIREAWTREIAAIDIDQSLDAITDDGQETVNLLAQRDIRNVVLLGVHLNMCVLGRPFAIRQMVHQGRNVSLIRDMTDTMYCSKMRPKVNHFAGTDLVVEHIEKYWCPSFTSADVMGGAPFRFKGDPR